MVEEISSMDSRAFGQEQAAKLGTAEFAFWSQFVFSFIVAPDVF